MTKRLTAKVGEYEKDGQTKGRYVDLGVILSNQNGEYALLDPHVSLAGVLAQQNALAAQKGQQQRDRVMVSIFERDGQQRQGNQSGGYGRQSGGAPAGGFGGGDIGDEIPF